MTTSAFKKFFEKPVESPEDLKDKTPFEPTKEEFKDDKVSKYFIGYCLQKRLCDWPKEALDDSEEGYKLIILDTKEKKGTSTKLSKSWASAVEAFNKASDTEGAILILTHSNKRWYKVSGKKNPNGLYIDAYLSLADYVQSFKNYSGPLLSEKDAEFYMEEDAQSSWKEKLTKIDGILEGKDETLAQNYHFFAVTFDRKTK
jgi:hypothetical protein